MDGYEVISSTIEHLVSRKLECRKNIAITCIKHMRRESEREREREREKQRDRERERDGRIKEIEIEMSIFNFHCHGEPVFLLDFDLRV